MLVVFRTEKVLIEYFDQSVKYLAINIVFDAVENKCGLKVIRERWRRINSIQRLLIHSKEK